MPGMLDITGQRFGMLVAVSPHTHRTSSGKHVLQWDCVCDCGNAARVNSQALRLGRQKSCGCYRNAIVAAGLHTTHGRARTKEHMAWCGAKGRCFNPKNRRFAIYGGRGITMSEEWRNDFTAFLRDMGDAPEGSSLDRIDNDGDYRAGNCRWVTQRAQCLNNGRNQRVEFRGEMLTYSEIAQMTGVEAGALRKRIVRGQTPEFAVEALTLHGIKSRVAG